MKISPRGDFFVARISRTFYTHCIMTLQEKIKADFMEAYKARNTDVSDTLRLLSSALHNRSIEKKGKGEPEMLTDEETLEIIRREVKRRKEAATIYRDGNRVDLAEQEEKELRVLEVYLPQLMSEEEVTSSVKAILAEMGPTDPKDFGKIMGAVMKELKGKADAAVVTKVLKSQIS